MDSMSRTAEFNGGVESAHPVDKPAPVVRRAGPIGPNTEEEERMWQREIEWSRSH